MLSFAGPEAGAAPTLLLSPTTHTPGACSTALVQGSWAASARGASDWDAVLEPGAPEGVPWVRAAAPAAGCGTPVAGEGDAVRPCRGLPVHGRLLIQRGSFLIPGRAPVVIGIGVVTTCRWVGGRGGVRGGWLGSSVPAVDGRAAGHWPPGGGGGGDFRGTAPGRGSSRGNDGGCRGRAGGNGGTARAGSRGVGPSGAGRVLRIPAKRRAGDGRGCRSMRSGCCPRRGPGRRRSQPPGNVS